MITLTREEAQRVLDALEEIYWPKEHQAHKEIEILRARLSAPEPEPVAYRVWGRMGGISFRHTKPDESEYVEWDELYLAPPQSEPPCKTGSQCIGGKCLQCVVSEPEPVAYMDSKGFLYNSTTHPENYTPLYKPKEDAR